MHAVADEHETPENPPPPLGLGDGWMLHAPPFSRSTSVALVLLLSSHWPTAVHTLGPVQDTDLSWLKVAPLGVGAACTVHVLPFQDSTRLETVPELLTKPTAVHELAAAHDTPFMAFRLDWLMGSWIFHLLPSHVSASGTVKPGLPSSPTAMHAVAELHDTADSVLIRTPVFGVALMLHLPPLNDLGEGNLVVALVEGAPDGHA